eukprot:CAMPEP_0204355160 /NCGR_PEP_ID=MMETSP0469-20131031/33937_1 /ASSEMBLY_ACC=CAM_ASM_000384 /TAXON_ID=2969 /ORGANISM="Oxyrrhis marina" /LENGTH=47 /DNA_ID= /DNA_START= /DNA_END= /DNA_ORIENTATION=
MWHARYLLPPLPRPLQRFLKPPHGKLGQPFLPVGLHAMVAKTQELIP